MTKRHHIARLQKAAIAAGGTLENDTSGRWVVYQCVAPPKCVWEEGGSKHLRTEWLAGSASTLDDVANAVDDTIERLAHGWHEADEEELYLIDE